MYLGKRSQCKYPEFARPQPNTLQKKSFTPQARLIHSSRVGSERPPKLRCLSGLVQFMAGASGKYVRGHRFISESARNDLHFRGLASRAQLQGQAGPKPQRSFYGLGIRMLTLQNEENSQHANCAYAHCMLSGQPGKLL